MSSNTVVAFGADRENIAERRTSKSLDKMSNLQVLVEEQNWIIGAERASVAELVDVEWIPVRSVITGAGQSAGTVRETICDVHDRFPI